MSLEEDYLVRKVAELEKRLEDQEARLAAFEAELRPTRTRTAKKTASKGS
jgi:molecular chaperone GrpE (heat shock protein)